MPINVDPVTEQEVAIAMMHVLAGRHIGRATFQQLKQEIPAYLNLSEEDLAQSETRPNEPMWEQKLRNIKSHSETEGNVICEGYVEHISRTGYQITDSGRLYIARQAN